MDDETARELAVGTADRLIYERGIRSVGMDDIRDASGVSLKRLYRLFPAKEQLVEAALRHREAAFAASLAARVEAVDDPRERLLAVFDHLRAWFDEPDFRGCPFVNAWGEAGASGGCVADAVGDQKRALRAYLERLVASVDGLAPAVAGQLFILANGAMVAAATLGWPDAAGEARAVAATLLGAQLGGGAGVDPVELTDDAIGDEQLAGEVGRDRTDPPVAPASKTAHMSERVVRPDTGTGNGRRGDEAVVRRGGVGNVNVDAGALMARVGSGDEHAFAELYDQLAPTLYGIVLRVVRDPAQSEEVTQEVFVELWRQAARFDSARGGVRGWAVTIARRRAVDRVRSEQSQRDRQCRHAAAPAGAPESPSDAVIDSLDRHRVRLALAELSDAQRDALELAYFDGLTHVEVAAQLGVPLGTAKTRIRDGLIRLRSLMEAHV